MLRTPLNRQQWSSKGVLCTLLVGFALNAVWSYAVGQLTGRSYLQRNAYATVGTGTDFWVMAGLADLPVQLLTAFAFACLLTPWPRSVSGRLIVPVVWVWIGYATLEYLVSGARIGILLPMVLMTLDTCVGKKWSKRRVALVALVGLVTVTVGGRVALVVTQMRNSRALNQADIVERAFGQDGPIGRRNETELYVSQSSTKFNSFAPGVFLLEKQGMGAAGWQPYIGSVLALVPRALLPDKPVPGSMNGVYSGHPARLVAGLMGMDRSAASTGVSPAAISLWELGYAGLILLIACNILNLYLVNSLLLCRSLMHKALGFYMIGIPLFNTIFAAPDVIVLNSQRIVLMMILVHLAHWVLTRKVRLASRKPARPLAGTRRRASIGSGIG